MPVCICVQMSPLYRNISHCINALSNDLIPMQLYGPYFQIRLPSQVLGVWTTTLNFEEDTIQPITPLFSEDSERGRQVEV